MNMGGPWALPWGIIMPQLQIKPVCQVVSVLECTPFGQCGEWPDCYRLRVELPAWDGWNPGQFVMLRPLSWGAEITWGRPFSICSADDVALDIFMLVAGRGTARLAQITPGEKVSLWGPLGKGFVVEPDTPTLLLAGGVGIAPFAGYALRHPKPENLHLLFGHRPPLSCYPFAPLAEQIEAEAMRESGSEDLQRFINLIRARMREYVDEGLALACGPEPFLRTVHRLALELGVRTQLSLENRMACGVGVCMGCVAQTTALLPVQVCTQGPMFWAHELTFDR